MEIAFPAVFIHFTNVRYLVQQQRIGEGRATMRVRFILNTLNNQDEDKECYPFYVFQKINMAIQDAKDTEPALNERCNLTYYDMPTTTNMLPRPTGSITKCGSERILLGNIENG